MTRVGVQSSDGERRRRRAGGAEGSNAAARPANASTLLARRRLRRGAGPAPEGEAATPKRRPKQAGAAPAKPPKAPAKSRKAAEMTALKKSGSLTIVAMLVVAALAIAFWVLLLSPKRDEAAKLGDQVEQVEVVARPAPGRSRRRPKQRASSSRSTTRSWSCSARRCPAGDETASLLVQVNGIAERAGGRVPGHRAERRRRRRSRRSAAPRAASRGGARSRRPRPRRRCCRWARRSARPASR